MLRPYILQFAFYEADKYNGMSDAFAPQMLARKSFELNNAMHPASPSHLPRCRENERTSFNSPSSSAIALERDSSSGVGSASASGAGVSG